MDMSIAAMSTGLASSQATQKFGIEVMKMAMDQSSEAMENLISGIAGSLDPNVGGNVDIRA